MRSTPLSRGTPGRGRRRGRRGRRGGDEGASIVTEARVALAELLAEAWRNREACGQIEALGERVDDLPLATRQRLAPAAAGVWGGSG